LTPNDPAPVPPTAPPQPVASPLLEEAESDLPLVPIVVGGVLLLAVVVLLARKK
jgi:hypothetical protein